MVVNGLAYESVNGEQKRKGVRISMGKLKHFVYIKFLCVNLSGHSKNRRYAHLYKVSLHHRNVHVASLIITKACCCNMFLKDPKGMRADTETTIYQFRCFGRIEFSPEVQMK